MGWTSTGDPYAHVGDSAMGFDSEQDAIGFAERHGWDYTVRTFLYSFISCLWVFLSSKTLSLHDVLEIVAAIV